MSYLIEERRGGVATLTLNRPESLNAFGGDMLTKLQQALTQIETDNSVRVVLLTGSGRAFSAGGDVKGFAGSSPPSSKEAAGESQRPTVENRTESLRRSTSIVEQIYELPKPTVAAIPGVAAGGGFSLALSCDIRLACESSRFTTAFAKLGLSGDYGGSYFLTQLVGNAKAKELYFSSEIIGSAEALRLGIVNQVYADDQFTTKVIEFVDELASMPPVALHYIKKNLNRATNANLSEVLDQEATNMTRCFDTEDHRAGARAFVTKEKPTFVGR